jgi:hypothetical protein
MTDMLKNGVIVQVPYQDLLWINPTHLVPKANGDMRLVMDMTKVNRFMKRIKFKMEGVSTLSELLSKNDYAISFDLKEFPFIQAVSTSWSGVAREILHLCRDALWSK